jgi:adenosylhomocysteine nucleosidase
MIFDGARKIKNMPKIIVLISADAEWRVVRSIYPDSRIYLSTYGEWFSNTFLGIPDWLNPILFFQGGWGKISAAASTQFMIDHWKPKLIINIGTCGGFEGEVEKGEIILVEKTIVYDIFEQMGDFDDHISHYSVNLDTSWLIKPFPLAVQRTLLVSGDRDLLSEDIPKLKSRYKAVAGDWESGAIAWVSVKNQTQCLILRGVTDLVGSGGGEAYEGNIQLYYEKTMYVMKRLIESLPAWIIKFAEHYSPAASEKKIPDDNRR